MSTLHMTMFVPNRAALLTLVLASIILVGTVATSRAQPVPQEISYQGTLADAENGNPVNGPVDLTFRLYDGPGEGAAPLPPGSPWENVFTDVSVNSGRFGVLLGSGDRPPLLDVLLSSNGPLWLEVTVDPADGPEEALPRTKLTSTAFALRAEQAQQAQRVADGAAVRSLNGLTNAVTLSGGENISISQDGNTLTIAAAVPEGGLTAVTSDETLSGAGTDDEPLALADEAVTEGKLAEGAVVRSLTAEDNEGEAIATLTDAASVRAGDRIVLGQQTGAITISVSDEVLSSVVVDPQTLEGNGTASAPLSLARNAVTSASIAAGEVKSDDLGEGSVTENRINNGAVSAPKLSPEEPDEGSGDHVLTYLDATNRMTWERPGILRSSIRWKENVRTLEDPLQLVDQLRGVRYDWKENGEADVGVIAEEVAGVLPELVSFDDKGQAQGVQYSKLVPVLIEAVKEQQQELKAEREKAASLEERVERLERLLLQSDADDSSGAAAERHNRP